MEKIAMEKRSLRDADVRQSLSAWLASSHAASEIRILHELKVPRPSARIDVALVNGELTSYEIKSDVDSLSRLKNQISACNRVFDKSYLVTTGRHVKSCMQILPAWWGLVLVCQDSKGVFVSQLRESRLNLERCIRSSLYMLTRSELASISLALCGRPPSRNLKHVDLVSHVYSEFDVKEVQLQINRVLSRRKS